MKVHEVLSNDDVKLEVARLLGVKPDMVTIRRKSPQTGFYYAGGFEVKFWLGSQYNFEQLDLLARLFKKVVKKVLPEYSEFATERPHFYDSSAAGKWINGFNADQWEEKLRQRLAKRRAGTACALEYGVRKPKA